MLRRETLVWRRIKQVPAGEGDGTPVGVIEPGDAVEHRRLARSIRSDQSDDLTLTNIERDGLERYEPAERDRHIANLEQCPLRVPHVLPSPSFVGAGF